MEVPYLAPMRARDGKNEARAREISYDDGHGCLLSGKREHCDRREDVPVSFVAYYE